MFTWQEVLEQAALNGVTSFNISVNKTVQGGIVEFTASVGSFGSGKFSVSSGIVTPIEGQWSFPQADTQADCCEGTEKVAVSG